MNNIANSTSPVQDGMENRSEVEQYNENEELFLVDGAEENTNLHTKKKRYRDEDDGEIWTLVSRNSKRRYRRTESEKSTEEIDGKIEVCITSKEKIPKQIELARFLKEQNISNITRVKYATPYKIFVLFDEESDADKLLTSTALQEKGWKCYKTSEVGFSFGIIRNIDLELSEKDVHESIATDLEIASVKRLFRRNDETAGWTESETIRLCFKGSSLPSHIFIYGLKVKVEPYVFPVTQCSKCWRFGHTHKYCPSKIMICPKCTKNHSNCETNQFKCINCGGQHMSLVRTCPIFLKEKRIRQLMAEFNCTFRKATMMYVPPSPQPDKENNLDINENFPALSKYQEPIIVPSETQSFSEIVKSAKKLNCEDSQKKSKKIYKKNIMQEKNIQSQITVDWDMSTNSDSETNIEATPKCPKEKKNNSSSHIPFKQLVEKLKNIIFIRRISLKEKIIEALTIIWEWLISLCKTKVLELPIFKNIFESLHG
nr:uncharacterized protein LOC113395620 [Vanessa tameamea]XP_026489171.1 uncharacterized protein LOC113395707 [Vanessa tameamea]